MFVYGTLDMAGFEIVTGPTLPTTDLWEGRVVYWNGQVYYLKSGVWEAVAVTSAGVLPPQIGEENKLLSTDGLNTFWTADPVGHEGEFLSWDGFSHIWDKPLPFPQLLNGLLSSNGTSAFWAADPVSAIPGQFLQWNGTMHVWGDPASQFPSMTLKENWLLTNNGTDVIWTADPTGQAGKFLGWDGTAHVWATPPGSVPDASGHLGEFLRSDGTASYWDQLDASDIPSGIPADNIGSGVVDTTMFDRIAGLGRYESTSTIVGGVLSVNADPTRFDLTNGNGVIIDYTGDAHKPTFTDVDWAPSTGNVVTNLATADQTYIMMDSTGTMIQQTTFPTPTQLRDNVYIGVLAHANRTTISAARSLGNHAESVGSHMFDFWNAVGPFNILGNTIAPNGATLTFQKSAGFMFSAFYNQVVTPKDPHRIPMSSSVPAFFGYRTRDSALGGTPADTTLVDPTKYDLNGVVTPIGATASNATVQRVFLLPTGQIRVQYGQQIYSNLAQALANMGQELFVTNPALVGYAILIGYIVAQQNATTLNSTLFARVFSAARFEVGPAAGALPSTTQQQAYDNSASPMIVLTPDVGAFNIRDAATPLGTDLFSVTDNLGTSKYIQVDVGGIKSPTKISPSLALVSDSAGAIVSLAGVTATELGFITDVTSNIQAQLNNKASISSPTITSPTIAGTTMTFTNTDFTIRADTADGADTKRLILAGGGTNDRTRGGWMQLFGNEYGSSAGGQVYFNSGDSADSSGSNKAFRFFSSSAAGGASAERMFITGAGAVTHTANAPGIYAFNIENASGAGSSSVLKLTSNSSSPVRILAAENAGVERFAVTGEGRTLFGNNGANGQFTPSGEFTATSNSGAGATAGHILQGFNNRDLTGTGHVTIKDLTPGGLSAGVGGFLTFSGIKFSGGSTGYFGGIGAFKESPADNNESGVLKFFTNANGGTLVERGSISSAGAWMFGPSGGNVQHISQGDILISKTAALGMIGANTADGSDNKYIVLAAASAHNSTRSGSIAVFGNEYGATQGGQVQIGAGDSADAAGTNAAIAFYGSATAGGAPGAAKGFMTGAGAWELGADTTTGSPFKVATATQNNRATLAGRKGGSNVISIGTAASATFRIGAANNNAALVLIEDSNSGESAVCFVGHSNFIAIISQSGAKYVLGAPTTAQIRVQFASTNSEITVTTGATQTVTLKVMVLGTNV